MMNHEKFDYTLWRQQQWQHETVHYLAEQARELTASVKTNEEKRNHERTKKSRIARSRPT